MEIADPVHLSEISNLNSQIPNLRPSQISNFQISTRLLSNLKF